MRQMPTKMGKRTRTPRVRTVCSPICRTPLTGGSISPSVTLRRAGILSSHYLLCRTLPNRQHPRQKKKKKTKKKTKPKPEYKSQSPAVIPLKLSQMNSTSTTTTHQLIQKPHTKHAVKTQDTTPHTLKTMAHPLCLPSSKN